MSKSNEELIEITRSEPSVLRKRSYEGMSNENWMTEVINELPTSCPVVSDMLSKLLDIMYHPEKKIPTACLIYVIIMFMRVVLEYQTGPPIPRQPTPAWTPRDIHAPKIANV